MTISILMCRPDFYGIKYEINPWMKMVHAVDKKRSMAQWKNLYQTILNAGANVTLIPAEEDWPDMVFTANAGLVKNNKIILSKFKHKERQGEVPFFKKWFIEKGFEILNTDDAFFEGAGDALYAGDTLFAGFGFRTERVFYEKTSFFKNTPLIFCELIHPHFYHIDTCFCPINEKFAIWYPDAFHPDSRKIMSENITLLAVVEEEAKKFACNAVVINNHIILPKGCPILVSQLTQRQMIVHEVEMDEFLKAGGAAKCLTLRIS